MIKIVKLVTGEELIADITVDNNFVTLDKPCALQLVPSRANPEQPTMALIPYAPFTSQHSITVSDKHVVWEEEPIKELYNQYNSIFGNGIQLASL